MNTYLLEQLGLEGVDLSYIIIALLALMLIIAVIAVIALVKYKKLEKKYIRFMGGNSAKALESHLMNIIDQEKDNLRKIEENRNDIEILTRKMEGAYQKLGLVKYDAFHEMGGKLSFSLALLNEKDDGFLINTVHQSESSYSYVKSVKSGSCNIELTKEEEKALQKALGTVDK